MYIIVDKSWIISINKKSLIKICNDHSLVLPASLAYESFTSDNKEQALSIWKKLNFVRDKIYFIERINQLIKYEIKHNEPFGSIDRFFQNIYYDANIDRIKKGLKIKQKIILKLYQIIWEGRGIKSFQKILEGIHNYFPQLENQSNSEIFEDTIKQLCESNGLLLKIYDDVKPSKFPSSKLIDDNWAIYRWLQMHLIYAIEYKRKYGYADNKINFKKLYHDHIDIEYLMLGVLNKGLATDDKKLKCLFNVCCKDGVLFSNN
jgi:hypothetical protein